MIAEQVVHVKTISLFRTIKQKIGIVFDFLKDFVKNNQASKGLRSAPVFYKGTNSYEVGNEFKFVHKNYYVINATVKEVSDEDDFFKRIVFQARTEPNDQRYQIVFDVYNITEDNSSLVKFYFIYEDIGGIKMNQHQYQKLLSERENLLEMYTEYLNDYKVKEMNQTESIYMEFRAESVYNRISDWREFKKLATGLCESVNYDFESEGTYPDSDVSASVSNDANKVGTKFLVNWGKDLGESLFEVLQSEYNDEENKYMYKIKTSAREAFTTNNTNIDNNINNNNITNNTNINHTKVPSQEITFSIMKIGEEKCFIEFNNFIIDYVRSEYLDLLSNLKKEVLKQFRIELRRLSKNEEEENVDNIYIV